MQKRVTTGVGLSLGVLAAPSAAQADDFQVTNLNNSGAGSLREALLDANADADADRILFNSKLSGTLTVSSEPDLYATYPVQIIGPGARRVSINGTDDYALGTFFADDVVISGLTLTGEGDAEAGLSVYQSEVTLRDSTVSGTPGAGISGLYSELSVERSLLADNSRYGLNAYRMDVALVNTTVSGNNGSAEIAGGILAAYSDVIVDSSTITGNSAEFEGGGIWNYGSDIELRGTLIADNTAPDGPDIYVDSLPNPDGTFTGSFNLVEVLDGESVSGSANIFGIDPKLKPLKDNGGPTDTHAFKRSPAKNKGPSDAPDSDQRGAPRKGQPDIGAYEFTKCKGVVVNFVGTSGKDKLKGTKKKDGMLGLGGNDKLKGKKGKDGLCGGPGKDKLIGGPGKDKFNGGPGKDKEKQ